MLKKRGEEIDEEFANLTTFFVHDMLNCVLLLNYNHTLMIAQLQRLENNRELKCESFLTKWKSNSQGKVCRHRRVWRDLTALSMSRECCITYTATLFVVLFFFLYFCNFPNYNFFKNDKRYPFPMLRSKIVFSWRAYCFVGRKHGQKSRVLWVGRHEYKFWNQSKLSFKNMTCQSYSSWSVIVCTTDKRKLLF